MAKLFKEVEIVFKMKTGTPEMVDSANALILPVRRVTIEDISEQLGTSMGTTRKKVHDDLTLSLGSLVVGVMPQGLTLQQEQ